MRTYYNKIASAFLSLFIVSASLIFGGVGGGMLSSCSDEPDASNFYTFKGQMMSEYLRGHEQFSMYAAVLERAGMMELLASYGALTCFPPTNDAMQAFLDEHLPKIPNDEDRFGYQLIVDENEEIVGEEEYHLLNAIDVDIDGIYDEVHRIGGLFVPAHINKGTTSLMSQLGFVPPDLRADGLEINFRITKEEILKKFAYLKRFNFITDSDAHFIDNVGDVYNVIYMEHRTFDEFALALHGEEGRSIDTMYFREHKLRKIL